MQCGGIGYTGTTACCDPSAICLYLNDYWSQCQNGMVPVPAPAPAPVFRGTPAPTVVPVFRGTPAPTPAPTIAETPAPTPAATITETCPRIRRALTDPNVDYAFFVRGIQAIKDSGVYDNITRLHANATTFADFHNNHLFLPWHRWYVAALEDAVRALGGEFACFAVPYWEWSMDAGNESSAIMWSMAGNGLGEECVTDGPFASWRDLDGKCLRRGGDARIRFASDLELASLIANATTYADFAAVYEKGPHARPHLFTAGQMKTPAAPDDPVFWAHHAYVDFVFEAWRLCHNLTDVPPELMGVPMTYTNDTADNWWSRPDVVYEGARSILCRPVTPLMMATECDRLGPLLKLNATDNWDGACVSTEEHGRDRGAGETVAPVVKGAPDAGREAPDGRLSP